MNLNGDGDHDRSGDASTELSVRPSSHGFNEEVAGRKTELCTQSLRKYASYPASRVRTSDRARKIGSVRRSNLDEFSLRTRERLSSSKKGPCPYGGGQQVVHEIPSINPQLRAK